MSKQSNIEKGLTAALILNLMLEAIILAGATRHKRRLIGGKNKFFVPIDGTHMGNIVVSAFEKSDLVSSIYIVGEKTKLEKESLGGKVRKIIQQKGGFFVNALEAFHQTENSQDPDKTVVCASCDSPFLNPRAINDLISTAPDVDLLFPYCLKEDFEELFPRYPWPYQIFREGEVKFGNVALVKPNRIRNKQLFGLFHSLRKLAVSEHRIEEFINVPRALFHALRLFGSEGIEIALRELYLKYVAAPFGLKSDLARGLSLRRISGLFSGILDCHVKAVQTAYPELCFDIDNESTDLAYAVKNFEAIRKTIERKSF